MGKTEIRGAQIKNTTVDTVDLADESVTRAKVDVTTGGSAVITKVIAGSNINISETGVDSGTGDVTVNASAPAHTIASHSDTTATGAELETLTDGSDAGALHSHAATYMPLAGGTFTDDVTITTDKKLIFRDAALSIASNVDGTLKLIADAYIILDAPAVETTGTLKSSGHLIVGSQGAEVDYYIVMMGQNNIGYLHWMEDEDYWKFSDDVLIDSTENIYFRDTAIHINSSLDGQLDIDADGKIVVTSAAIDLVDNGSTVAGSDLVKLTDGSDAGALHKHDAAYFTEAEHLDSSAGAGDAGKPIKLDAAGHVDASMINDADISHDSIADVSIDDHHAQIHAATHANGGGDVVDHDTLTNFLGVEHQKPRYLCYFSRNANFIASGYLYMAGFTPVNSVFRGVPMPRAGSIIGLGYMIRVTAQSSAGNVKIEVRKNYVKVFEETVAINGVAIYRGGATQAGGIDTFSAGDQIGVYITFSGFAGTINAPQISAEVEVDS